MIGLNLLNIILITDVPVFTKLPVGMCGQISIRLKFGFCKSIHLLCVFEVFLVHNNLIHDTEKKIYLL